MNEELDLSTLGWDTFDATDFSGIMDGVETSERKERADRDVEPIYLVINERNLGGYDIWLNKEFNCAGGRKLNTIGMTTLKEARDFCDNWKFEKAKNLFCFKTTEYDEYNRRVNVIPMTEYTYEELMNKMRRYQVVEYVSPTVQFPPKVKYVPEVKPVPELTSVSKEYHKSKLFLWYLGACKLNMRADKFVKYMAQKLNRKVSRQLTTQLVEALIKLRQAAKKNEEMQKVIKRNFGTSTFPELIDCIRLPSSGKNYR